MWFREAIRLGKESKRLKELLKSQEQVQPVTIKPCPFCGESAYISDECIGTTKDKNVEMVRVGCRNVYCPVKPRVLMPRTMAINAWNQRALIPVPDSINWISVEDRLPKETDLLIQYLICHYNSFIEVAKFEKGEWFHISDRLSEPDYKLSKEGQPDYWAVITQPDEL